ncbi:MAG: tetratricopeptide repeat protein [Candidatus Aminicenantes bacterium]|nr:tetratricopeptide repeat protein [Candidatus Aminicenantes bacterium]
MRHASGEALPRQRRKSVVAVCFFESILLFTALARPAGMQETDPFYRKWLETGEASYFARSYDRSVEYLEIAVFGLSRDKNLQARAYVFLALCRTALGLKEKANENLNAAAAHIGWDGLRAMNLQGEARSRLDNLLTGSPRSPAVAPQTLPSEPEKSPVISAPPEPIPLPPENRVTPPPPAGTPSVHDLLQAMETNPRNPDPYYELSRLLRQTGEYDSARDTLEKLLNQNPAEIRAHLEIGRVEYLAGNPKRAVKSLEKFLSLTANVPVEERFRDEGRALLLLSAARKGDQKKVVRLLAESEDLFRPERFDKMTLDPADLERLRILRQPPSK